MFVTTTLDLPDTILSEKTMGKIVDVVTQRIFPRDLTTEGGLRDTITTV